MPSGPVVKGASPFAKSRELDTAIEKLHQPPQWTFGGRSGLFVPEKHFIDANGLPATLQTTQVHPPVPNEWLEQLGLPITDADVLEQDPDNDGFNNLDEWAGHTNPTDPNSHPEYYTKLKLKSATEEPFRLVFSSWIQSREVCRETSAEQVRDECRCFGADTRTRGNARASDARERKGGDVAGVGRDVLLYMERTSRILSPKRSGIFTEAAGAD
jgi:hypothetical protein